MTIRPRAARVRLTAGSTGWARAPYDPDTDPALPPDTEHLENVTHMSTDHTLSPADIADRCRILGCTVTVQGGNYRITPPADATTEDGSRPSVVHIPADADFRSKADRTLSVRNLRHNGVDVTADRDWSGKADTPATDEPEIPKLEIPDRPRETATWTKVHEPASADEPELDRSDEIVSMLAAEMHRVVESALEPIAEDLAKLAARIDALETVPARAAATRVDQLDRSVGSLAQRVAGAERTGENLATGLETARHALARVDTRLTDVTADLTARLDALESATPTTAVAPSEAAWIGEMRTQITDVLSRFRGLNVYLPRATIAEAAELDVSHPDSPDAKRLSYVLKLMRDAGLVESVGVKSSTRWRLVTPDETPEN